MLKKSEQIVKKDIKILEQLEVKIVLTKKELNFVLSLALKYKDIYPVRSEIHNKMSMILSKHKRYQTRYIQKDRSQYHSMSLNPHFRINDYSVFHVLNKGFFGNFRRLVGQIDSILLLKKLHNIHEDSILKQVCILRRFFELSYSFSVCYGYFSHLDLNKITSCVMLKLIESLSKMKNSETEAFEFFNEYKKIVLEKSIIERTNQKYFAIHVFKSRKSILMYFKLKSSSTRRKENRWKREA